MLWLSRIITWLPLIAAVIILIWLLRQELLKGGNQEKTLKKAIIVLLAINILAVLFQLSRFYLELKNDPLGQYLLPGKGTNYFFFASWNLLEPLVLALALASFWVILGLIIFKIARRPLFSQSDFYLIFLTAFVVGYPDVLVLLLGSLLLMILIKIIGRLLGKKDLPGLRLRIAPFLIIVALLILIFSIFPFYQFFLNRIGFI